MKECQHPFTLIIASVLPLVLVFVITSVKGLFKYCALKDFMTQWSISCRSAVVLGSTKKEFTMINDMREMAGSLVQNFENLERNPLLPVMKFYVMVLGIQIRMGNIGCHSIFWIPITIHGQILVVLSLQCSLVSLILWLWLLTILIKKERKNKNCSCVQSSTMIKL